MSTEFQFDVFLSHSSRDKAIVREIAQRLKNDGLRVWFDEWEIRPDDSIPMKTEEGLESSRVLVLCISANAFGSDWVRLEAGTFRFRDPLNKGRRFISLALDDTPIKDSITQILFINWFSSSQEQEYRKLFKYCHLAATEPEPTVRRAKIVERITQLPCKAQIYSYALSSDGKQVLTGASDKTLRLWDIETGNCLRRFKNHTSAVREVHWSSDGSRAFTCDDNAVVRFWDVDSGESVNIKKSHFTNREMDVFRLLAHGSSPTEIANLLGLHPITVRFQVQAVKKKLGLATNDHLRKFAVHFYGVNSVNKFTPSQAHTNWAAVVAWNIERDRAFSEAYNYVIRPCTRCWEDWVGANSPYDLNIWRMSLSSDRSRVFTGAKDNTIRLWDVKTGNCLRVFEGHTDSVLSIAWSPDERHVLSGSADRTMRLWNVETGHCIGLFMGHTNKVRSVGWSSNGCRAFSGDQDGFIRVWLLSEFIPEKPSLQTNIPPFSDQVQYTNAKVLLVGDTSAGKTGLAHRLATDGWSPSDSSTLGAWSTQWKMNDVEAEPGVEREIWLWDFGGQADQRLIHQLYMDRAALILLLFNADQEDVLPGLRDWQTALRRCVPRETPKILVAGRVDAGFKASRGKLQKFSNEYKLAYHETSAREGTGCKELRAAIMASIPWNDPKWVEKRTSPLIFKLIKDEILRLRDEGQVLHTFKELRELLLQRLPNEQRFTDEILRTVIGLLDSPGVVKELDYGTYILLQPEWVNLYAQAVIRTLRGSESELGCLPLKSIAEGKLVYQNVARDGVIIEMKRLQTSEERIVLAEMERQLMERGLCLRQGDKLVFPSHCGRERPALTDHPSVFVSYTVKGYLDDIYATLVVRLADSGAFSLKDLWRDAADFDTLGGCHRMGLKLTRETASNGEVSVYFGPGVTQEEHVIFANYINAHLIEKSEEVRRLRYYVCPYCYTPKGNPQVLMEKLLAKKQEADTECDKCGKRFPLWDVLEKKFASRAVREQVEGLKAEDVIRLDSRRKGKLLALEVGARITSADQKSFEIPSTEDEGLDMELEFTDEEGKGTGSRLYLQLKAGNSYLTKRKTDGAEVFKIKKQSWVKYWLKQPNPVMLVVGTLVEDKQVNSAKEKLEFADVRWMEITELLRRESDYGKKPVKQIVFKGERLDVTSVRRWREKILNR